MYFVVYRIATITPIKTIVSRKPRQGSDEDKSGTITLNPQLLLRVGLFPATPVESSRPSRGCETVIISATKFVAVSNEEDKKFGRNAPADNQVRIVDATSCGVIFLYGIMCRFVLPSLAGLLTVTLKQQSQRHQLLILQHFPPDDSAICM